MKTAQQKIGRKHFMGGIISEREAKVKASLTGKKQLQKALASQARASYIARSFEKTDMRRPKGIKTKKSVAKRFKITGTGKVMRMRAGKRHLLQTKGPKRRRNLGTSKLVDPTDAYRILQNLPFSH